MKVLIVDDHKVVRRGLMEILHEGFADMEVAEASNYAEAMQFVWNGDWDVVLLDIGLPGRNGFDVLVELKRAKAKLPVIVISMYPEENFAIRALKSGAASYLTKESVWEELIKAVNRVVSGARYITPSLGEKLARDVELGERKRHEALSNREFQVMCMLGNALTVKEIAAELFLSVKTISTYRTRILEKMQLSSNADLIRYVRQHRLINLVEDAAVPVL